MKPILAIVIGFFLLGSQPNGLTWQVPKGWKVETPKSKMRKAQFLLPRVKGDPEDGVVVIFYFGGQGGGVQANVQRWYKMFDQPDGKQTEDIAIVKSATVNALKQTTVEISGTYLYRPAPMVPTPPIEKPDFKMYGVVIETSSGPWFVRFVGPKNTVEKWHKSFQTFLRTFTE